MTKFRAFTIGAVLAAAVASLIIEMERSEIARLRADNQSLREERDHLHSLVPENARLSDQIARINRPEASVNEPPRELLRLRGEVARLRQANEGVLKLSQDTNEEIERVRQQIRGRTGRSLKDMFGSSGIDTDRLADIQLGATTNDVVAELRRVGANFMTDQEKYVGQDKYVQAAISLASTNNNVLAIKMEFYFDDGKLTSRRDWPEWKRAPEQQ